MPRCASQPATTPRGISGSLRSAALRSATSALTSSAAAAAGLIVPAGRAASPLALVWVVAVVAAVPPARESAAASALPILGIIIAGIGAGAGGRSGFVKSSSLLEASQDCGSRGSPERYHAFGRSFNRNKIWLFSICVRGRGALLRLLVDLVQQWHRQLRRRSCID